MLEGLKGKKKVVMLTAYDYQMAKLVEQAGVDLILVGDSLGMVVLGYPTTKQVTMEEMLHHTKAVARGAKKTPIIGDMPINSYSTPELAVENARKFIQAGAKGVKVEGCCPEVVTALLSDGIPVMGHLGLLPQTAQKHKLVGKEEEEAERILRDALTLDRLGVFSIVLECIPEMLGKRITENVKTITIGIGAGKYCDGQVLVINDLLGMDESFKPKFVKKYANLSEIIRNAVSQFKKEVEEGSFPDEEHSYH
jgi:3-methyl-2-oxobutanoate hydroxymethyltransferase